jgi:murein tripeptide amidase MpaA
MVNPDGVIMGNSRTSAAGKDLNREFKSQKF